MTDNHDSTAAGLDALKAADWTRAKACFEQALSEGESPEAHDGLGVALWWLNAVPDAHQHRTIAFNGYKARGEYPRAARLAAWLAREQVFLNGNVNAMQGWLARADRLLSRAGSCPEQDWVALFRASVLGTPEQLESVALAALESAQSFDDSDLEMLALAFCGSARVAQTRVDAGMAQLDEAMTAATSGEVGDYMVVSEIFCVMLSSCELAGDLVRCENWCLAALEYAARRQCPFLSAYCRTTYGSLLIASGQWSNAERALTDAIRTFETGHRALRVHAVLKLADLRVWQGRLEEATVLLSGFEDHGAASAPRAHLHLARGEAALARAVLEQRLQAMQPTGLNSAGLLLMLIEVLLTLGDSDGAYRAADALDELARQTASDVWLAQAELARARIMRHAGDSGAVAFLESAMMRLRSYEQSLISSRARLEMAHVLQDSDWAGAVTWARAALASFERLGALREADEAASLLRQLGANERGRPRLRETLTQREAEVLSLLSWGLTNREIAGRLVISPKTVEHHVGQILGKLGVRSRAEAAAFAVSHNPRDLSE